MSDVFVDKIPKALPADIQREYFLRLKEGDMEVRTKLIEHNLKLVVMIVNKYSKDLETVKEMISIGVIGLIKAVDTFDISRGKTFSTYATTVITNEILMEFRKLKKSKRNISIDNPLSENENLCVGDTIIDDADIVEDYERKEEQIEAKKKLDRVKEIVVSFNSRLTKVLSLRLGLFGARKYMQNEIADLLNISRSYVSRLELKGLTQLKTKLDNYDKLPKKRRGKKVKPIFLLLEGYTKDEIYNAINSLTEEDRIIVRLKYGSDLNNPVTSPLWNKNLNNKFNNVLRIIKQMLDYERERKKILGTSMPRTLTEKDINNREAFNHICELLISMNLKEAELAIHKYLEASDLLKFERLIGNLIILSIREQDLTFTRVIQNLYLISSGLPVELEAYKNNFYSSLLVSLEDAKLYLEIIVNLRDNTDSEIDIEKLEQAYKKALEMKK